MTEKKQINEKERSYMGCYGEQVSYGELEQFISDVFEMNRDAEKEETEERFATCIWGHSGCVLGDTEIEVRKIGDGKHHKIVVVNPKPE